MSYKTDEWIDKAMCAMCWLIALILAQITFIGFVAIFQKLFLVG